ncbi:hypothetical protein PACTADRAFT_50958 [Pachysolen tannophilus NRRL Y-2460]|uniref:Small ribosomal subunit protein uS5m n=1 Tax=Pachysolen tannophilus NRRL Y-2460 TaxID=669874 RepID=A0A1E4TQW0_PACTA|nr:hypothetical protein PACTADRAFT_50958 [Pachysolen tannophilus NRRL Y-2460]
MLLSGRSIYGSLYRLSGGVSRRFINSTVSLKNKNDNEDGVKNFKKEDEEKHLENLSNYYTSDILESIKAAESSIKPEHWNKRRLAQREFGPHYLDDFTKIDPFWDFSTTIQTDFEKPLQPIGQDIPKGHSLPDSNSSNQRKFLAEQLSKLTGLNANYIANLSVRPLVIKRVSNQTAKGKIASFYSLVVVGDRNGMVGLGEGKDKIELSKAIKKAHWNAVKNLQHIPRLENRTIYGDIEHKFHSCLIQLRSAPPGFGLRVNHHIFEICECAGIKDLAGKVYRSRNGMNVVKGTVEALTQKQITLDEIATQRGKKLVDLRNVYYST